MKFVQGIHIDNHPADQPEGTYRDARNVIVDHQRGAISNELGFKITDQLPEGYYPVGRVALPDSRIVLFLANGSGGSEIGVIEKNGNYKSFVNDTRLNFSLRHPITAIARLVPKRFTSEDIEVPVEQEFIDEAVILEDVE